MAHPRRRRRSNQRRGKWLWPDVEIIAGFAVPSKVEDSAGRGAVASIAARQPSRRSRWRRGSWRRRIRRRKSFHFKVGSGRGARTVRLGRDMLLDVDEKSQISVCGCSTSHPIPRTRDHDHRSHSRRSLARSRPLANMLAGVDRRRRSVFGLRRVGPRRHRAGGASIDQIAHVVTEVFPTVPGFSVRMTLTAFRAYSKRICSRRGTSAWSSPWE